jgi:hypothetical protein
VVLAVALGGVAFCTIATTFTDGLLVFSATTGFVVLAVALVWGVAFCTIATTFTGGLLVFFLIDECVAVCFGREMVLFVLTTD